MHRLPSGNHRITNSQDHASYFLEAGMEVVMRCFKGSMNSLCLCIIALKWVTWGETCTRHMIFVVESRCLLKGKCLSKADESRGNSNPCAEEKCYLLSWSAWQSTSRPTLKHIKPCMHVQRVKSSKLMWFIWSKLTAPCMLFRYRHNWKCTRACSRYLRKFYSAILANLKSQKQD